jgi:hypothetical protein
MCSRQHCRTSEVQLRPLPFGKAAGWIPEAARALLSGFMVLRTILNGRDGMPLVMQACTWKIFAAQESLMLFLMLGAWRAHMIQRFGTDDQRACYVGDCSRLVGDNASPSRNWFRCGSLRTRRARRPTNISHNGTEVFHNNGEQNITDQIIYPFLPAWRVIHRTKEYRCSCGPSSFPRERDPEYATTLVPALRKRWGRMSGHLPMAFGEKDAVRVSSSRTWKRHEHHVQCPTKRG